MMHKDSNRCDVKSARKSSCGATRALASSSARAVIASRRARMSCLRKHPLPNMSGADATSCFSSQTTSRSMRVPKSGNCTIADACKTPSTTTQQEHSLCHRGATCSRFRGRVGSNAVCLGCFALTHPKPRVLRTKDRTGHGPAEDACADMWNLRIA